MGVRPDPLSMPGPFSVDERASLQVGARKIVFSRKIFHNHPYQAGVIANEFAFAIISTQKKHHSIFGPLVANLIWGQDLRLFGF